MGHVEGAVYWLDKEVSLSTEAEEHPNYRAATTAMSNNLHKQDVMFGLAWLAYEHSIAVVNEHVDDDEVMAA